MSHGSWGLVCVCAYGHICVWGHMCRDEHMSIWVLGCVGRAGTSSSPISPGAGSARGQDDTSSGLCLYSEEQSWESHQSLPQQEADNLEVTEGSPEVQEVRRSTVPGTIPTL